MSPLAERAALVGLVTPSSRGDADHSLDELAGLDFPTAGEVPIVQAMLALGVGAGPAGALLMTLPPISVPSLAIVSRSFRPKVLVAVTLIVVASGIAGGLLAVGLKF